MNNADILISSFQAKFDQARAKHCQKYFKCGPGEYGDGDKFLGIAVPDIRNEIKQYLDLDISEISSLLASEWHEIRLAALFLLIKKYKKHFQMRENIVNIYIQNLTNNRINNWDLVDSSAPHILGEYFLDKNHLPLFKLAETNHLWCKRAAIIATLTFIRNEKYDTIIKLAEDSIKDTRDLIQKASGWMLRETGKKNPEIILNFLDKNSLMMPSVMLRYAIERFPEKKRQYYLKMKKRKGSN